MAKLGSYYSLCPLIENKSLLGISEDSEKNTVIVTLGKNIAGKYRVSIFLRNIVVLIKKSDQFLSVFKIYLLFFFLKILP